MKQMKGIFDNETDCKRILREIKLLRRLNHPYIISLYDIVEPEDLDNFQDIYIILELADSDLKKVLKSGLYLTPVHIKTILYNLLGALYYIHSAQVLHRDLKPANVLVDENGAVKLCDFGLARSIAPKTIDEECSEENKDEIFDSSKNAETEAQSDKTPSTAVSIDHHKDNEDKINDKDLSTNTTEDKQDGGSINDGIENSGTASREMYGDDSEVNKDFEPKGDTPRLHFKKPKEKKDKKKQTASGTKRKIITTGFGLNIGHGGVITQNENKEEKSNDSTNEESKEKSNHVLQRKRDIKEVIKNTPEVVKSGTKNTNVKSDLSVHVVTRWYRSPEIILLERDYGPPIDIWSVGCIFAELLTMLKENAKTQFERKPLFPGTSGYPLSPSSSMQNSKKKNDSMVSKEDQLGVIIDKLGTPSEEDTAFISDPGALSYLQNLPKAEKKNFKELYPYPGDEALDLLNKMLQFNPYKRASLNEGLEHPHLAEVRDVRKEIKAKTPIILDFEYEHVNKEKLRELFVEEIIFFRNFYKRNRRSPSATKVEQKLYPEDS